MMSQFSSVWNFSRSAICLNNWIKFVNILIYKFDSSWNGFAFHQNSPTVKSYFQKTNSSQTFILKSCTDNSNSSATLFNILFQVPEMSFHRNEAKLGAEWRAVQYQVQENPPGEGGSQGGEAGAGGGSWDTHRDQEGATNLARGNKWVKCWNVCLNINCFIP